jgi:tetratricopeptide (TPR) repeat protein
MSRLREAIEAQAEALVIYKNLRVRRQEARALNNMGIVFAAMGEYEEALGHYKRALKIDQELGDRLQIALKLANIGGVYLETGTLDKSEQYLRKAISIAEQLRDGSTLTDGHITLGQVHLKRGEPTRARRALERGLAHAVESGSRYQEIRARTYLALARLEGGDSPLEALEMARQAAQEAHTAPLPIGEIYGLAVEALALARLGRPAEAADRAAQAARLSETSRAIEGADEIWFILARLAKAAGRVDEAVAALARALGEVQSKARRLKDPALRQSLLSSSPAREILAEAAAAGMASPTAG